MLQIVHPAPVSDTLADYPLASQTTFLEGSTPGTSG
jgi:hypothetical protein